jgi:hypothetical protein
LCPPDSDWEDCGGTPPPGAGPFGKLVNVRSPQAELVVRGSTVTNLTLKSVNLVGAVNSTFDPPLYPHNKFVQPHPGCGVLLAGETLCDPRAHCVLAQTGGVECACSGIGLRDKDGSLTDGRQCVQDSQMRMLVQSDIFSIRLHKPSTSKSGQRVQILLQAEGERAIMMDYNMRTTYTSASGGASVSSTSKEWEQLHDRAFSFHGLHIAWDRPPSADSELDLDGAATRLTAAKTFVVDFSADCYGLQPCTRDGDSFETVLAVTARSDSTYLHSAVTIATVIECLLSCNHSKVWVERDVVTMSTPFRVQLFANDVDNFPVSFTRADISLIFRGRNIPMQWTRGFNRYVADVPAELTSQPGLYDLVVNVSDAWSDDGRVPSCEVLRRTIVVNEGFSTMWLLVGASSTAVVLMSGLVVFARRRREQLQAILLMLLTEVGQLVFSVCMALANLATDGIVCARLLHGDLKVSTELYTAAFTALLCFGVVSTVLSLGYRLRNAVLVKAQFKQLASQVEVLAASTARRQSQQHEWELVQTGRTKVTLSLSLLSVAAQGALWS